MRSRKPAAEAAVRRSILIHVVGPDGRPMAGVNIHRSVWTRKPSECGNLDRATDERGEVRFDVPETHLHLPPLGQCQGIRADVRALGGARDPEQSLPEEFTFRLKRGTVIGGIVRDQDGKPIKGATVEVRLERGASADGRAGPDAWLAEGDAAPDDRCPGTLDAGQRAGGGQREGPSSRSEPSAITSPTRTGAGFKKEQGVTMQALRARTATITMQGGLSVTGTVTDPEGQPVAGAVVVRGEHPYWEWGSQEVRTDARGVYRLPPLPRGPLTITVVAPGWMPVQKKVDLQPGLKPVDFRLEPGKELRIRFIDRLGTADPGRLRAASPNGAATRRSTITGIPTSSIPRSPTSPTKPASTSGPGLRTTP